MSDLGVLVVRSNFCIYWFFSSRFFKVSEMVKKLYMASTPTFVVDLMKELVEKFCRSHKWSGRQTFVFICQVKCLSIYILLFCFVVRFFFVWGVVVIRIKGTGTLRLSADTMLVNI